jgi:hypothetical protein
MCGIVTVLVVFGAVAYMAAVLCNRASRRSSARGLLARVLSSLVLWLLGCVLGLAIVTTLSARTTGDYRTWNLYGGWWLVFATGVVGGIPPWLVWPRRPTSDTDPANRP